MSSPAQERTLILATRGRDAVVAKGILREATLKADICADIADGKTLWRYDMMKELKVIPYHMGNCSPLIVGDLVMVITSNGVSEQHASIAPGGREVLFMATADARLDGYHNGAACVAPNGVSYTPGRAT